MAERLCRHMPRIAQHPTAPKPSDSEAGVSTMTVAYHLIDVVRLKQRWGVDDMQCEPSRLPQEPAQFRCTVTPRSSDPTTGGLTCREITVGFAESVWNGLMLATLEEAGKYGGLAPKGSAEAADENLGRHSILTAFMRGLGRPTFSLNRLFAVELLPAPLLPAGRRGGSDELFIPAPSENAMMLMSVGGGCNHQGAGWSTRTSCMSEGILARSGEQSV